MIRRLAAALSAQSRATLNKLLTPTGRRAWRAELASIGSALARASWLRRAGMPFEPCLEHCIEHWVRTRPHAIAIADEHESLNWTAFNARIRSGAAALSQLGIRAGSRVAIVAENSVNLVTALFAARAAGAVVMLLDPRGNGDGQVAALRDFGTEWLLYDALEDGEALAPALRCPAMGFDELALRSQNGSREFDAQPQHLAHQPFVVLTTSGTTGKPKPVVISNLRSVLSGFGIAGFCLTLTRNDALHCVLPLSHATALMTALCPALLAGCKLVVRRRFVPSEFWDDVISQQSTHLLYVGELVRALLSAPSKPNENEHGLRMAYGNGMTLDVWHRFQASITELRNCRSRS